MVLASGVVPLTGGLLAIGRGGRAKPGGGVKCSGGMMLLASGVMIRRSVGAEGRRDGVGRVAMFVPGAVGARDGLLVARDDVVGLAGVGDGPGGLCDWAARGE